MVSWCGGIQILLGGGRGFFGVPGWCARADRGGGCFGRAFARDLHAFYIEFEFFVALDVAGEEGEEGEVFGAGVGRGGAREELALEGGGDGGIEEGILTAVVGVVGAC